jgi:hypothetical protein
MKDDHTKTHSIDAEHAYTFTYTHTYIHTHTHLYYTYYTHMYSHPKRVWSPPGWRMAHVLIAKLEPHTNKVQEEQIKKKRKGAD